MGLTHRKNGEGQRGQGSRKSVSPIPVLSAPDCALFRGHSCPRVPSLKGLHLPWEPLRIREKLKGFEPTKLHDKHLVGPCV